MRKKALRADGDVHDLDHGADFTGAFAWQDAGTFTFYYVLFVGCQLHISKAIYKTVVGSGFRREVGCNFPSLGTCKMVVPREMNGVLDVKNGSDERL